MVGVENLTLRMRIMQASPLNQLITTEPIDSHVNDLLNSFQMMELAQMICLGN